MDAGKQTTSSRSYYFSAKESTEYCVFFLLFKLRRNTLSSLILQNHGALFIARLLDGCSLRLPDVHISAAVRTFVLQTPLTLLIGIFQQHFFPGGEVTIQYRRQSAQCPESTQNRDVR